MDEQVQRERSQRELAHPDVYVSVGSNVNPLENLSAALRHLSAHATIMAVSSVYQSPPFGYLDQPDFLDVVVKLHTILTPVAFKLLLYEVEHTCGRDRANQLTKWGPLPLDMDILLWGDGAFTFGDKPWQVPDEDIVTEAAIAIPLAEIAPELVHPTEGVTLAQIAARFHGGTTKTDYQLDFPLQPGA